MHPDMAGGERPWRPTEQSDQPVAGIDPADWPARLPRAAAAIDFTGGDSGNPDLGTFAHQIGPSPSRRRWACKRTSYQ